MANANVYVSARTALFPGGAGITGVTVALYTTGGALLTQGATNAQGSVFLGLRAEGTYEIRVTANGVPQKGTTQSVTVTGTADQAFDVVVDTAAIPTATDPRFCRVSGKVLTAGGKPAAEVSVHFSEGVLPQLLSYDDGTTKLLVPSPVSVKTDAAGYAVVDLVRKATYSVLVEGWEDHVRQVEVPDLTSAPLPDMLFPVVDRVEWKDGVTTLTPTSAPTLALVHPATKVLTATTVYRSGLTKKGLVNVNVKSLDTAKLTMALTSDGATLQTVAAGNATLEVSRGEEASGITIEPLPAVKGSVAVTVT